MKRKELIKILGAGPRDVAEIAQQALRSASLAGLKKPAMVRRLKTVVAEPGRWRDDEHFAPLARRLCELGSSRQGFEPRQKKAPYQRWGDDIDPAAIEQMENAVSLPVAAAGALMPDAHVGYGLPIGGVLATRNAVVPYAVGVDIACRVKLTVLDLPPKSLEAHADKLRQVLERETRFGIGSSFRQPRQHEVMDDAGWQETPQVARLRDKAWSQLGTSGSGNHFVEYGVFDVTERSPDVGLDPGTYLALLSHSGSRGAGATVAAHYSRLAMDLHPELPKNLRHLAWLDLDSAPGQEYWQAMQLMGRYASANHHLIHRHIARELGAEVLFDVENHHNFAWLEEHGGERLVVHRKGATPAGSGDLGIIPGSMASPAYVVRGRGGAGSLRSAAHGAGRVMSRKQAKSRFTWSETKKLLDERGVSLLSAGLDEVPMAYRDIDRVMAAQADLVETLGRFFPRLVKMAPAGERAED